MFNRKYAIERRTVATNIPYYVTENFHEYQGSLGRLEAAVEDEYKTNLRYACNRERNYSEYYHRKTVFVVHINSILIQIYRGINANEGSEFW